MRKIQTIVAVAMMGLFAFTGCKKKDDSPTYSMKATIGGTTNFSTTRCVAVPAAGNLSVSGWTGTSTSAAPPQITLALIGWSGAAGTITLDSTYSTGYATYLPDAATSKQSKTGTVTITSVTATTISGTFSFTADDGTAITNGSFTGQKP